MKQGAQKLVVQFPDQMFAFNLSAQADYLGLNPFQLILPRVSFIFADQSRRTLHQFLCSYIRFYLVIVVFLSGNKGC